MALLKVFSLWPCGCCVLIVGWVAVFRWPGDTCLRIDAPETLGGSYVCVAWPLASGTAFGPLWCYNENCRL